MYISDVSLEQNSAKVGFLNSVNQTTPKEAELFAVYEQIKNGSFKPETEAILQRFAAEIRHGFPNGKGEYQKAKAESLKAVVFAGCLDRSRTAKHKGKHSGRINVDIDENSPEELADFLSLIKQGSVPYIEAAALSISGPVNGSFWVNFRAEMPSRLHAIPPGLVKMLNLNPENFEKELHRAFYEMFADMLSEKGIKAGKTNDFTRCRYLSHDAEIYINSEAKRLRLGQLEAHLQTKKQAEKERDAEADALNIIEKDAFRYAEKYAEAKGLSLADGQKHLYIFIFATCANMLGIPEAETIAYFEEKGIKITTNCVSGPYRDYSTSFGRWAYRLNPEAHLQIFDVIKTPWKDATGKRLYLKDVFKANKMPLDAIFGKIWIVPTGFGKTSTVIEAAKLQRVVFVVPTLTLCEQVAADATKAGIDAIIYNGEKQNRQSAINRINSGSLPQMIVCTYSSSESLQRALERKISAYNLVIDEFHNTTAAASKEYMLGELNALINSAKNYKSITGLTGTPLFNFHPATADLQTIKIEVEGEPKKPAQIINAKDIYATARALVEKSVQNGRLPIVFLNNKSEKLEDFLSLLPKRISEKTEVFNSLTKIFSYFLEMLKTGKFSEDVLLVVTTSVFKEGLNISKEIRQTDIIILGSHHPADIRQFTARLRVAETKVFIVRKDSDKAEPKLHQPNPNKTAENMISNAEKIAALLNVSEPEDSLFDVRANLQSPYIRKNGDKYEADFLSIQNRIFEIETLYYNETPERLEAALQHYGFCFEATEAAFHAKSADEKLSETIRKADRKEKKQTAFADVLKVLKNTTFPQITAERATTESATPKEQKLFFEMFLTICKHSKTEANAVAIFEESRGKKSKVNLAILRLKGMRSDFKSHQLGNAPSAIIENFAVKDDKEQNQYSPEELKELFLCCLSTDATIDLKPYDKPGRIDKVLKKLRLFFEVERAGANGEKFEVLMLSNLYRLTEK